MDRFEGFADAKATFFRQLAKKQSREWFQAHKTEFEEGWNAPMKRLLDEVRTSIDDAYPHCELEQPKVFRIFRDVRFSKDKAPYKTHIAGYLAMKQGSKAMESPAALYLHVGVETMAAAGHYMMTGVALERFRAAVVDETRGTALTKILAKLDKKGFTVGAHEQLKRVPKGFEADHPRADLLKRKGLVVSFPAMPTELIASRKIVPWIVSHAKLAAPLVQWLVFATA